MNPMAFHRFFLLLSTFVRFVDIFLRVFSTKYTKWIKKNRNNKEAAFSDSLFI